MPRIHAPPDAVTEADPVRTALEDPQVRDRILGAARRFVKLSKPYSTRTALEHDAEDLASRAQAKSLEKASTFDPVRGGSVTAWVIGFVRNIARERDSRKLCGDPSGLSERRADPSPSAQDSLILESDRELVRAALAKLHPDDRELARLCYTEGMKPAEIAVGTGITAVNARVRLCRIRKELAAILSPSFPGGRS